MHNVAGIANDNYNRRICTTVKYREVNKMQITGKTLQATGKDLLWMQHLAKNVIRPNTNARVNPLLQQVQNAMARQSDTKTTDAVSNEMQAKLQQLKKESKVDPAEESPLKGLKQVQGLQQQLLSIDSELHGALWNARSELRDLVDRQEEFTNILNGTADFENPSRNWAIAYNDRERFEYPDFVDFNTYLKDIGYQGDGTKEIDFLNTEWITAQDSMGNERHMLPGQVLVKGPNSNSFDVVIFEDQVPFYEQYQADKKEYDAEKKAYQVAVLKEYAAEKLPQVQSRIEDFPKRINQIVMAYAIKKAALIEQLPGGDLKDEMLKKMKGMSDLAEGIKDVEPGDGKELLKLLNQMIEKQREIVLSQGGSANKGEGVQRIKKERLPENLYA